MNQRGSDPSRPAGIGATLARWIATGLGLGYFPVAPGTIGALWGVPLALAIHRIPSLPGQAVVILVLCAVGIPICTSAARQLGGKDPGSIVWDEIASLPITFFLVGPEEMSRPLVWALGFILHRVFDITKPPPARQLERLPEGLGIMAADWAAALYSCLALHLCLWLGVAAAAGG